MKATLIRITCVALFVCGVLLVSGCIKINTTVSIKADGSGTWKVVYAMPTHMIRQVQMARELTLELEKFLKQIACLQGVTACDLLGKNFRKSLTFLKLNSGYETAAFEFGEVVGRC